MEGLLEEALLVGDDLLLLVVLHTGLFDSLRGVCVCVCVCVCVSIVQCMRRFGHKHTYRVNKGMSGLKDTTHPLPAFT